MSKKHFIAIAADIKWQVTAAGEDQEKLTLLRNVVTDLCRTFVTINPNFDRSRFLTACGF